MTTVKTEFDGAICHIILARPEVANVISKALADDLCAAVTKASERSDIACVVLRAEGKVFCGGGDMRDFGPDDPNTMPEAIKAIAISLNRAILLFDKMDKPVLCAVQGVVAGAGVPLVALADVVIASERSRFVPAYDKIGLTPDGGASYYLPRVMGERKAKEFLLLGRSLSAQEAENSGLVTKVVPHDQLMSETMLIANSLAQDEGWRACRTLELVASTQSLGLEDQLYLEANSIAEAISRPNAVKSVKAFLTRPSG